MRKGILIFIVFILALVSGVVACWIFPPIRGSFLSPNGRYRINLRGEEDRPLTPFGFHSRMTADVVSGSNLLGRTQVHTADWLDGSFYEVYKSFRWHDENVFGLHGFQDRERRTAGGGDALTITNSSSKKVNWLNLRFGDSRFLILEMDSNRAQTVYVDRSMGFIYFFGEFEDGTPFASNGVNFRGGENQRRERFIQFCATVDNNGARVNSTVLQGANTFSGMGKPLMEIDVPTIVKCGD